MVQTLVRPQNSPARRSVPPLVADFGLDEDSPFGLQGLKRETLQVLKPDCINRLAVAMALRGKRSQIREDEFAQETLLRHRDWVQEYRVVHLIEKSLWIDGHSDLVMTLTRNPTQIPDNPPESIKKVLAQAYLVHPQSTIWYGVPLFSDETNADGLPIPLTAAQVREESQRRIAAAQDHAVRWGWLYRAAFKAAGIPAACWRSALGLVARVQRGIATCQATYRQARSDARRRTRALIRHELRQCRTGESTKPVLPRHRTQLGRMATRGLEATLFASHVVGVTAPFLGVAGAPAVMAKLLPLFAVTPMVMVSADPFLFVELPDEPGKLRHLGHWYWQVQADGPKKLHVHI